MSEPTDEPVVKLKTLRPAKRPVFVGFDAKGSVCLFWAADDGTQRGIEVAQGVHRCEVEL